MTPTELERLREITEDMRATIYGPQNTWELCDFIDEIRSNFEDLEAFLASVRAEPAASSATEADALSRAWKPSIAQFRRLCKFMSYELATALCPQCGRFHAADASEQMTCSACLHRGPAIEFVDAANRRVQSTIDEIFGF
jgi:hypothetical protein